MDASEHLFCCEEAFLVWCIHHLCWTCMAIALNLIQKCINDYSYVAFPDHTTSVVMIPSVTIWPAMFSWHPLVLIGTNLSNVDHLSDLPCCQHYPYPPITYTLANLQTQKSISNILSLCSYTMSYWLCRRLVFQHEANGHTAAAEQESIASKSTCESVVM